MKTKTVVALAALAALTAGAAQAQIAPRSNAPLDISADASDFQTGECKSVWSGDVEALQAKTRLRASRLTVFASKSGDECGDTERLVADGPVYYVNADRNVRADNAVYTARGDSITLTGNVVVVQGKSVARADRVIIDLQTGQSQMFSNTKGRGSSRRVRGVFYPSGQKN